MKKQKGFSLIELLIVVAIILVIAAIAIPNMMRARIAANEAAAVESIRAINTAEVSYTSTYPTVGYSASLADLAGGSCPGTVSSASACLIDQALASTTSSAGKSGYYYIYTKSATAGYTLQALPVAPGSSGVRGFYVEADAVIRYSLSGSAAATSPGIQ